MHDFSPSHFNDGAFGGATKREKRKGAMAAAGCSGIGKESQLILASSDIDKKVTFLEKIISGHPVDDLCTLCRKVGELLRVSGSFLPWRICLSSFLPSFLLPHFHSLALG